MIDLHSHLLPGIDDGSPDLSTSLAMARMAVEDGIVISACTPHILPGVYANTASSIRSALAEFASELKSQRVPLEVVIGADIHVCPDLVSGLQSGRLPRLNDSRYFLLEPPRNLPPPNFERTVFSAAAAGFVPVITHPERLGWAPTHYPLLQQLVRAGAWMQLTAGSVTGAFGQRVQHLSARMLGEGLVHLLASDAHNLDRRAPRLAEAAAAAALLVGDEEAQHLVTTRPQCIVSDRLPLDVPLPRPIPSRPKQRLLQRLFAGG